MVWGTNGGLGKGIYAPFVTDDEILTASKRGCFRERSIAGKAAPAPAAATAAATAGAGAGTGTGAGEDAGALTGREVACWCERVGWCRGVLAEPVKPNRFVILYNDGEAEIVALPDASVRVGTGIPAQGSGQ
eukprot:611977-Prorocentrum_minimum.AAC.1